MTCIVCVLPCRSVQYSHNKNNENGQQFCSWTCMYIMKNLIAERVKSILVNLRYLKFKLLKYKENNQKNWKTFDHNFKNISLYIMKKVFCFIQWCPSFEISKMALSPFCDETLHILYEKQTKLIKIWY